MPLETNEANFKNKLTVGTKEPESYHFIRNNTISLITIARMHASNFMLKVLA